MDIDKREECRAGSALKMDMSFGHEGGGDFSLPDYLPEIQRLLYVTPSVLPETKFLSGNVLELGGTLTYSVLYLGSDGKLSFSPLVCEYSADTALPVTVSDVGELFVDCEMENTSCRVTGPRSLNIKTRLRSRIMSDDRVCDDNTVLCGDDKNAPLDLSVSVERLCSDYDSVVRCQGMTTGSATGEMSAFDGEEPLSCEGSLCVSYCEGNSDGVLVRGDVYVKCLFMSDDGIAVCKKTKLPFEITVPVRDIALPSSARAWGRVASVSVTPSETGGCWTVNAEYDIEAEALCGREISLCRDAYSTEVESSCETKECEILGAVSFGSGQLSVSGDFDLKNAPEGCSVCDTESSVGQVQVINVEGKLYATGALKLKVVYGNAEEHACGEYEIPFKYELPLLRSPEGAELQSRVAPSVLTSGAKIMGDKISASSELFFSFEVLEKKRARFVTAVRLGTEKPHGAVGSGVKVYYPSSEESLWNVCKRYHASKNRILKVNGIEGDIISPGKPVIIF
ncbi:MAG: hypothetical protein E7660_07020 [Ruminococcaceae bacterium]|nr:hypothetical protein [Oscillospiraceae bacterium]